MRLAAVLLGSGSALLQAQAGFQTDILRERFKITRQSQIDVRLGQIRQGCPDRDCIPAIDNPVYTHASEPGLTEDDDLVVGVRVGDRARAWPVYILNHHEVVNDRIGATHIAVTWCPLCGSALVFEREVSGGVLEFAVSGLLVNSDLVLYDRQTHSLWQQITGQALSGPLRGKQLRSVPFSLTTWREWRQAYPDTQLLSSAGEAKYANKSPYGDYDRSKRLLFPAGGASGLRLHPKTVVYGVHLGERPLAVSERALRAEGEIEMQLDQSTILWRRAADGMVSARLADGTALPAIHRMYWFAWISFNPGSVLYDPQGSRSYNRPD